MSALGHLRDSSIYAGTARLAVECRLRGIRTGRRVTSSARTPLLRSDGEVTFGSGTAFRGIRIRSEIGAISGGSLTIGERTFINEGVTIVAASRIELGNHCLIGEFSAIFDSNYHAVHEAEAVRVEPVLIGNNVWLGRAAIVLPGTVLGDHSVITAGSVVRGRHPARSVIAGNPGVVVAQVRATPGWFRS